MLVVTSDTIFDRNGNAIPFQTINRTFGIATFAPSGFTNWKTGFRKRFGGESKSYTRLITRSRSLAMSRLEQSATNLGGNAVTTLRFDSNCIANDLEEIVAYGTAVRVLT